MPLFVTMWRAAGLGIQFGGAGVGKTVFIMELTSERSYRTGNLSSRHSGSTLLVALLLDSNWVVMTGLVGGRWTLPVVFCLPALGFRIHGILEAVSDAGAYLFDLSVQAHFSSWDGRPVGLLVDGLFSSTGLYLHLPAINPPPMARSNFRVHGYRLSVWHDRYPRTELSTVRPLAAICVVGWPCILVCAYLLGCWFCIRLWFSWLYLPLRTVVNRGLLLVGCLPTSARRLVVTANRFCILHAAGIHERAKRHSSSHGIGLRPSIPIPV